jgi:hypothetical protein
LTGGEGRRHSQSIAPEQNSAHQISTGRKASRGA